MNIYEPTVDQPYKIPSDPITLRVACSAGVNRSATVGQYLKTIISQDSIVFPQYGADYGDYDNNNIVAIHYFEPDGFKELFGCDKQMSVQAMIFSKLGYKFETRGRQQLRNIHKSGYKSMLSDYYWNFNSHQKNVFVLINDDEETIRLVIKRLTDLNVPVDLVILRLADTIYYPKDPSVEKCTLEAYKSFLEDVKNLLKKFD